MSTIKKPMILGGVLAILLLSLALGVAACGGSSSTTTSTLTSSSESSSSTGGSTTTAALTGDAATISANWMKFFDGTQPASGKAALLENGQQYAQQIKAYAATSLAKLAKAEVLTVKITSSNSADVTYSLVVSGTPVLTNQQGKAVLQNGTWKVSAQTFQALLAMAQQTSTTAAPGGTTPTS